MNMAQNESRTNAGNENGGRAREAPRPSGYVLYCPTLRCNFNCLQCTVAYRSRKRDELSLKDVLTVFRKSRVLEHLPIQISGGEPFVREDIVDVLSGLAELGHPLQVFTNGYFPEKVGAFLDRAADRTRLTFSISVDGLENTHNRIRGNDRSFARALETILMVKARGLWVQADCTILPDNIDELGALQDFFRQKDIPVLFMTLNTFPDDHKRYDIRSVYDDSEIPRILPYLNVFPTDIAYVIKKKRVKIRDCHAGLTSCYIDPEGIVAACGIGKDYSATDLFTMGRLRDYGLDFDRLWHAGDAWKARDRVKACAGCYNPCEVMREVYCHRFMAKVTLEELSRYLPIPSELEVSRQADRPFFPGAFIRPPGDFIWIEDRQEIFLHIGEEDTALLLTLAARDPDRPQPVCVEISHPGEDPLAAFELPGGFWKEVACPLPEAIRGRDITLRITVKHDAGDGAPAYGVALRAVRSVRQERPARSDEETPFASSKRAGAGFHLFEDAFFEALAPYPLCRSFIRAYLEKIPHEGRLAKLSGYQQYARKFGASFWERTEREMRLMLDLTGFKADIYPAQLEFMEKLSRRQSPAGGVSEGVFNDPRYPFSEHLLYTLFEAGIYKVMDIAAILDSAPAEKAAFLDAGFGPGLITAAILERKPGWTGEGLDESRACHDYAAGLLRARKVRERAALRVGTLHADAFPAGSFDYIVASNTLARDTEPNQLLQACKKLLRAEGRLVACLPVRHPTAGEPAGFAGTADIRNFYGTAGFGVLAFYERQTDGLWETTALLAPQ
jgi:MoaA/NifB/PqqE/SkfB family radical SAM enzyme/SAM-dependent methyltransferase